jgi:hypothetical protein
MPIQVKIKSKKGEASVTTKEGEGVAATEQTTLFNPPVIETSGEAPLAEVSYTVGNTINLGNFNSRRVMVHITMPTPIDKTNETFEVCRSWAEQKLKDSI